MSRRTRSGLAIGVLVAAVAIMGAGLPAKRVPPPKFARGVCTSVQDWIGTLQTGANKVKTSLSGRNPSLKRVRAALVHYMGQSADATGDAINGIKHAGVPTTPKGDKASAALVAGFTPIQGALHKLQHQAEGISTKNRTLALSEIRTLDQKVTSEFQRFEAAFQKLDKLDPNHQLQKAFTGAAACQALSSSSGGSSSGSSGGTSQ
jgi:hypothetical protein